MEEKNKEIKIARNEYKELNLYLVQIIKQASEIIRLKEENCLELRNDCIEKCENILKNLREIEEKNLTCLPF